MALADMVVVTAPGFDPQGARTGNRLLQAGLQVSDAGARGDRTPQQVAELVHAATAAIVSSDPFTESVFEASPALRILARLGVGVDSIDLPAATRAGVVVTTTPGLNDETCADHALALLLAVSRRIVEHDASVRRGDWDRGGDLTPWNFHDKRVGVVGYGRIGRAVVRRLAGFGTPVKVFDPQASVDDGIAATSLEELLGWAEAITLHVPLTPSTAGLIGRAELALMPPGSILVNTSRGGLVDEPALLEALASGHLRGAGLDVFEDEPPRAAAWRGVPNAVLSPHVGGLSVEAIESMQAKCVQQVLDRLAGRTPDGVVNPEALA